MKKNIAIIGIILAAIAQSAFANGVEKTLPADANNVQIKSVKLAQVATSSTTDWNTSDGSPNTEFQYGTALEVTVTYQSKNDQNVAQRIEGESDLSYDATPTVSFDLPVTDAEVAAIKGKKLDPRSLVTFSVSQQSVDFDKAVYTNSCVYGTDSGSPENEATCVKHETVTESRPVLSIDRK